MAHIHRVSVLLIAFLFLSSCAGHKTASISSDDPFVWLEDVEGAKPLEWVKAHNMKSLAAFEQDKRFKKIEPAIRGIVLAKDRIPHPSYRGGFIYNFWQDEHSVRGLWRRATVAEYKKANPRWDVLIDLDRLAKKENENWVWKGADCLPPSYDRCLLSLSRGGKDAVVVREFDVPTRKFVDGGFVLPEAKSRVAWLSENALLVATDFGPGTMTLSGYPRQIKLWKRGEPLPAATSVFEVKTSDVSAQADTTFLPGGREYVLLNRAINFWENEVFILNPLTLKQTAIPMPSDANVELIAGDSLFLTLRSEWTVHGKTFKQGSVVALAIDDLAASPKLVHEPDERSSVTHLAATRDSLYLVELHNVRSRLLSLSHENGSWRAVSTSLPSDGLISIASADPFDELALIRYESHLTPPTIFKVAGERTEALKQLKRRFDSSDIVVEQLEAASRDGEMIPYFVAHKKGLKPNGLTPTVLYGYGGFEIPMTPYYLDVVGKVWLEKGGAYAIANIRGGGEFGPKWHQAALREKRQVAFNDFIAVSEDLIKRGITSPSHLGISGGSNGGLLVGSVFVERPDLFNAVMCKVPLLDMMRYHKLLAGHSWVGEYGDPDDSSARAALLGYSPYQNVKKEGRYPKVFFMTSTKDDRVHPGHARKMVAKMESQGHNIYYFENTEGGHSAAANLEQRIRMQSLEFTYLSKQLGLY